MRMPRRGVQLAIVLAAGLLPAAVTAQGVTYRSTTKIDFGGTINAAMKIMGAGGDNGTTTYVAGHKLATDSKDGASIIDVDAGTITFVNKKEKSYSTVTFAEMGRYLEQTTAQMDAKMQQAKAEQAAKQKEKSSPDVKMDYKLSVDKTGEHEQIAGNDAQRSFITLTMTPRDANEAQGTDHGNMVVLIDTWNSTSGPIASTLQEFRHAYMAKAGTEFKPPMKNLAMLFAGEPQAKAGMEAAAKELSKIQGVNLRSTTYIIGVPEGQKFDRQLALNGKSSDAEKDVKPAKGFFGKLNQMTELAKQQAKEQQQSQNSSTPPHQGTIAKVATEVVDVTTGVPSGVFSVPAGYKEVKWNAPNAQ